MKIFVTGATGWIGSAVVEELTGAGHEVLGLARSSESAARMAPGAEVLRGDLDDLASLREGTEWAHGVVHLANKHDWGNPTESDRAERAAVEAVLEVATGTGRTVMVANGLSGLVEGRPVTEDDPSPAVGPASDRGGSENLVLDQSARAVRAMVVRFAPSVHGAGDWGFVDFLTEAARKQGVSGYVDDGSTLWSAVHRSDAARLIRLGVEKGEPGTRLHAVAEEAITTREIAQAIGDSLGLGVTSVPAASAEEHFGFVGGFFAMTMTASSELTRKALGWRPTGPGLLDDIRAGAYTGGDA